MRISTDVFFVLRTFHLVLLLDYINLDTIVLSCGCIVTYEKKSDYIEPLEYIEGKSSPRCLGSFCIKHNKQLLLIESIALNENLIKSHRFSKNF